MKNSKSLLVSVITICLSLLVTMPVFASEMEAYNENAVDEVVEEFVFDENSKTIISYTNVENEETLVIPEQINGVAVEGLSSTMFNSDSSIKSVVIPSTVVKIGGDGMTDTENSVFATLSQLEEIVVQAENKKYASIDGVLISADGELLCYPQVKADEVYTLPAEITSIGKLAFENVYKLKKLCVSSNPFVNIWALGTVCNFDVECMPKTNIEQYCKDNQVNYQLILLYGDADNDGSLTAADSAQVLQKVLNNSFEIALQKENDDWLAILDVDCSGNLTSYDSAIILQKALDDSYVMPCENN